MKDKMAFDFHILTLAIAFACLGTIFESLEVPASQDDVSRLGLVCINSHSRSLSGWGQSPGIKE